MNEIILLKLGELVLKGLNRRSFEDKLQANIHRRLHPYGLGHRPCGSELYLPDRGAYCGDQCR